MAASDISVQRKPLSWQEMTRQAMVEEARKQAPMNWEVPVDQLYAPSSDVPVSGGFAPGGAEYDPTPEMIASMVPWGAVAKAGMAGVRELAESAPRILGNEVGAIGPGVDELLKKSLVPGKWKEGSYSRVTEELPIEFLQKYKGNALRNTDLSALKKSIQEEGLHEPLILSFSPTQGKIKLVEGNHRLEALRQLGYTHAPVRGSRSHHIDDVLERLLGKGYADYPTLPFKPSIDKIDPSYYPADMKPSDFIDFEKLLIK